MNLDIYEDAERLAKRYGTRDPFELLDAMNVADALENCGIMALNKQQNNSP